MAATASTTNSTSRTRLVRPCMCSSKTRETKVTDPSCGNVATSRSASQCGILRRRRLQFVSDPYGSTWSLGRGASGDKARLEHLDRPLAQRLVETPEQQERGAPAHLERRLRDRRDRRLHHLHPGHV